jgi:hypothetical protein
MQEMKAERNTNPAGREGRPISLHPLKPADALRGLMMVKPETKSAKKTPKKTARKK